MKANSSDILAGLLQHNYLPAQKRSKEELPPEFSSVSFTPVVAQHLAGAKARHSKSYSGYDSVEYRLTRFNGVPRSCALPHPIPYAALALCIHECWAELDYILSNRNSMVRPRRHADGRLVVMDYESGVTKAQRQLDKGFGCRFMVRTDIANFFPSVYSHAIPWASVGFDYAKSHRPPGGKELWFNRLDERVRFVTRNETQGVPIGPGTSNIITEVILARVDECLRDDFVFERFIDDYTAYCATEDEAQQFVRRLAAELARYKLQLSIAKTEILALPTAASDAWVAELALHLPRGEVRPHDVTEFMDYAIALSACSPDGSVLKYALKSLLAQGLNPAAKRAALRFGLALAFHQPVLLPLLAKLLDPKKPYAESGDWKRLEQIAITNANYRRSDGVAWAMHFLARAGRAIPRALADRIVASRDCVPIVLLYRHGRPAQRARVAEFAQSIDTSDLYGLDQCWLLLYELYCDDRIANPYGKEDGFEIMRDSGVTFRRSLT